ncbi:TPA: LOW QUALITY PROTEIN: hypothetical protein N0F65_001559 [Lagenidium giganteum]|uniref:Uncharacterized protein n=1 Tax=Lagenidium giganteum TaxID=4803 RepID=A0AAV2YKZ5_9STRA|nr:TPA: LOW QUALITY PROTEIN: hypothetical protein N0F65_001559 [Lagenidium giganteum]
MSVAKIQDPPAPRHNSDLLRVNGMLNDKPITILIDSAERFDGTETKPQNVSRCVETVVFNGKNFNDIAFVEWPLSPNHDVILGTPWLLQSNDRLENQHN